jgi:hypothetical protein
MWKFRSKEWQIPLILRHHNPEEDIILSPLETITGRKTERNVYRIRIGKLVKASHWSIIFWA